MSTTVRRLCFLFLSSILLAGQWNCAVPRAAVGSRESLLLADGTEIPCRIEEITDQEVFFKALDPSLAYRYGDRVPRGQIEWIKLDDGVRVTLLTVSEYLKLHADQFEEVTEEEPEAEEAPVIESVQPQEPRGMPRPTAQPAQQSTSASRTNRAAAKPAPTLDEPEGPGLRFRPELLDTLSSSRTASFIGLRLPQPPRPQPKIAVEEYSALADFVVASGAAGLVLYRAERMAQKGMKLPGPSQNLVDAIRSSEAWKTRKEGLRAAHHQAALIFREKYDEVAAEVRQRLGFRAKSGSDAFVQFMIYLRTHGNLMSRRQRLQLRNWFGREFEQAVVDLLANFEDWYYIAVVSARALQL